MDENRKSYKGWKYLCGLFGTIGGLTTIAHAISEGGAGGLTLLGAISTGLVVASYMEFDSMEKDYSRRTLEKTLKEYLEKSE